MRKLDREKILYLLNVLLALSFLLSLITGIIKWPSLTIYFTGIYRVIPAPIMTSIHDWSGAALTVLVFIHLVLHRKWIVTMSKKIFKRKAKDGRAKERDKKTQKD